MFSILIKDAPARAKIVRRGATPFLWAAFQMSSPPVVWQADLEKMSNTTISLREKEGVWELGYTSLGQEDFVVVASFDERHEAEKAYAVIQRVMESSSGPIASYSGLGFLRFLLWFIVVIVVVVLLFGSPIPAGGKTSSVSDVEPSARQGVVQEGSQAPRLRDGAAQQQADSPKEIRTGVPVNADDVLPRAP